MDPGHLVQWGSFLPPNPPEVGEPRDSVPNESWGVDHASAWSSRESQCFTPFFQQWTLLKNDEIVDMKEF